MSTADIFVILAVFAAILLIEVMVKKQREHVMRSVGSQLFGAICFLAVARVWAGNIYRPERDAGIWIAVVFALYAILWVFRFVRRNIRKSTSKPANH